MQFYLIVSNLYSDLGVGDQLIVVAVVGGGGRSAVHQTAPLGPGRVGGGVVVLPPLRVRQAAPLPLQVGGYNSSLEAKQQN